MKRKIGLWVIAVAAFHSPCGFAQEMPFETIAHFTGTAAVGSQASLVQDNDGALYGTSRSGGDMGYGAVFELPPAKGNRTIRKIQILYSFQGDADGFTATSPLTLYNGSVYGTTLSGGDTCIWDNQNFGRGCGTVFRLDPPSIKGDSWTHTVLHSFASTDSTDGITPGGYAYGGGGGLYIDGGGTIYGTTQGGGDCTTPYTEYYGCGAVFSISPGGNYSVLYRFQGETDGDRGVSDGKMSGYALFPGPGGMLYGVTNMGGNTTSTSCQYNQSGPFGCGTVFKIDPSSGRETVLYRFTGGKDGALPTAPLVVDSNGNVFGTASTGGLESGQIVGGGVVFEITNAGHFRVIHEFKGKDGWSPNAPLSIGGDIIYGTTEAGGGKGCIYNTGIYATPGQGCGVAFSLLPPNLDSKSWTYTILHRFSGHADGGTFCIYVQNCGDSGVFVGNDGLYGTTAVGGAASDNNGTGGGTAFLLFAPPVARDGARK